MQCNLCKGPASQVSGEEIYPHQPDLYRKRFWKCSACGAFVGCHADGKPLGTLADQETRRWRMKAHAAFDPLWQRGGMSRGDAYRHMQAVDAPIGGVSVVFQKNQRLARESLLSL